MSAKIEKREKKERLMISPLGVGFNTLPWRHFYQTSRSRKIELKNLHETDWIRSKSGLSLYGTRAQTGSGPLLGSCLYRG